MEDAGRIFNQLRCAYSQGDWRRDLVACPFCEIAAGRTDAVVVFRNDNIVAFLDRAPIREGHVQIIPVRHVESFDFLAAHEAAEIMAFGQHLSVALKALYRVERVGLLFTGGDIPHAHAHVVPLVEKTDITSTAYINATDLEFRAAPRVDAETLLRVADQLKAALSSS